MDALSPDKRYCKIRKLKTRKCLNEIRTRRQVSTITDDILVTKETGHRLNAEPRKRPNILRANGTNITKTRLTIRHGMFAKGVRSETISRPELSEEFRARVDENLYKIIDLANGQPEHQVTSSFNNQERNTNTLHSNSDMEIEVDLLNRSNKDIYNYEKKMTSSIFERVGDLSNSASPRISKVTNVFGNKSKVSPLCITPTSKNISCEKKSPNVEIRNIVLNTSASDSDMDEKHYELYKEFNEMLPTYLNKYLPIVNAEEIEDDIKGYLKEVYKESCLRESEKNLLGCITSRLKQSPDVSRKPNTITQETMEQSILLNPIQYLKQVQNYQSSSTCGGEKSLNNSFNILLSNSIECSKTVRLDEPGCSHYSSGVYSRPDHTMDEILQLSLSSDSSDEQKVNSKTTRNVISIADESPEYTYYPRKMN